MDQPSGATGSSGRSALLGGLLWLGLAGGVGTAFALGLGACGLGWPSSGLVLSFCPVVAAERDVLAPLIGERSRQRLLETRLDALRLALVDRPPCPEPVAEAPPPSEPQTEPETEPPPVEVAALPPDPPEAPLPARRPEPPPLPEPPPQIAEAAPDDRMRIPDDPADPFDVSFVEGCWVTDPFRHHRGQRIPGVSSYCFDAAGQGWLEWRFRNRICRAPARVVRQPAGMYIEDADTICSDGSRWWQDRLRCVADAGGVAACSGESHDGDGDGRPDTWTVNLYRRG